MTTPRRPVTVVIPVYGGMVSLRACVEAVLATVDRDLDSVLIVNDCGPDADAIERELLTRITGERGVRYERNARNLGFVGTCNRAALELSDRATDVLLLNSDTIPTAGWIDALSAAVHDDPRNGIACARSDAATIATLPFRRRRPGTPLTRGRVAEVHAALRDELPAYSVAPVAMGFCFLVRREVLDRFGLFDEAFAPGYGEENDLCLRAAEGGVRSLIVHGALVFHEGGDSFGSRRTRLRARHELLLMRRHPHYHEAVQDYLARDSDPVDVFADALVPDGSPPLLVLDATRALTDDEVRDVRAAAARLPAGVQLTVRARIPAAEHSARATGLPVIGEVTGPRIWDAALTIGDELPDRLLAPRTARSGGADLVGALDVLVRQAGSPVQLDRLRTDWAAPAWTAPPHPMSSRVRLRLEVDARAPRLGRAAARVARKLRGAGRRSRSE